MVRKVIFGIALQDTGPISDKSESRNRSQLGTTVQSPRVEMVALDRHALYDRRRNAEF